MSFSENCRRCSVKVDNGTGVLVSPNTEEYSYILTAKHNLYHDYENKKCTEPKDSIKLVAYDESIKLSLLKIYELDECNRDIAILKIKKVDIYSPKIFLNKIKIGDEVFLYGYPENRRKDKYTKEEQTPVLKLEVLDPQETNEIIVKNDEYYEKKDINGYSGGGVFKNINDESYLVGIEFRMDFNDKSKEQNNTRLRFFSIKAFDEIVDKYNDELVYLDDTKNFNKKYNVEDTVIDLGNTKSIILKTVPVEVDGKILNVSIYPVTIEEYDLFCKSKKYKIPYGNNLKKNKKPVINIDWNKANEYCIWLKEKSNKNYRLPSAKDWEFISLLNMPDKNLQDYIVCREDFKKNPKIAKVGSKKSGKLNIFDMPGNIYEWCFDNSNNEKIIKGSTYNTSLKNIDVCKSESKRVDYYSNRLGFRIVF